MDMDGYGWYILIWGFPEMGVYTPTAGWFRMEHPMKMDDLGVPKGRCEQCSKPYGFIVDKLYGKYMVICNKLMVVSILTGYPHCLDGLYILGSSLGCQQCFQNPVG